MNLSLTIRGQARYNNSISQELIKGQVTNHWLFSVAGLSVIIKERDVFPQAQSKFIKPFVNYTKCTKHNTVGLEEIFIGHTVLGIWK